MSNLGTFLILRFEVKRTDLQRFDFIIPKVQINSLLSTNQSYTFGKTLFSCFSIFLTLSLWRIRHVSSVSKKRLNFTVISMSLIKMKNSKGPSIDPCGTPQIVLEISEKEFSKFGEHF